MSAHTFKTASALVYINGFLAHRFSDYKCVEIFGIFGIVSELLLAHRFSESEFSTVEIFGISELF